MLREKVEKDMSNNYEFSNIIKNDTLPIFKKKGAISIFYRNLFDLMLQVKMGETKQRGFMF